MRLTSPRSMLSARPGYRRFCGMRTSLTFLMAFTRAGRSDWRCHRTDPCRYR